MEMNWGIVGFLAFFLVAGSFVMAFLEEAANQRNRERERREAAALQRKGVK